MAKVSFLTTKSKIVFSIFRSGDESWKDKPRSGRSLDIDQDALR